MPFAFRRLDQMHLPEGKAAEALCRTAVRLDVGYPPPRPARSALTAAAARALLLRVRGGRTATPVDGGRLPQLKLSLLATARRRLIEALWGPQEFLRTALLRAMIMTHSLLGRCDDEEPRTPLRAAGLFFSGHGVGRLLLGDDNARITTCTFHSLDRGLRMGLEEAEAEP